MLNNWDDPFANLLTIKKKLLTQHLMNPLKMLLISKH